MCQFDITTTSNKKNIPCFNAWDIFNTVLAITKDETEARTSWRKAGSLKIGEMLTLATYNIKRIA